MAERRTTDLSYGHFGEAIYESNRKEWVFTRQPGIRNQLSPITAPRVAISPSLRLTEPEKRPQSQALRQQTQLLGSHHPELVPGLTLLPFLLHTSQLITSLTAVHDPAISELLDFGKAVDIDNQRSGARTIPIVAMAGGEAGEAVRIIRVREERAGWGGHKGVRLAMPEVGSGEEGWWFGDGAPVRQICFGDSETGKTSWLAIRLPASTIILRPQYHRLPTVTGVFGSSKRRHLSRIDPNHFLTISISRTGGIPHSDVTFNPWYNRQCAIIDQSGQWSVWDLEGQKKKRNAYGAKARQSGYILDKSPGEGLSTDAVGEDGWGRVCWVGNVNTLVACNRRHLAVLDLKSDPPIRLSIPDLGLARTPNWILDIKRSPVSDSHLFVVTTSQIFQLEIGGNNIGIENENRMARARILLSWRHFRDGDDTSLRMEILGMGDVEYVLLYSRLNKLITTYQFSEVTETPSTSISVSDPYIFTLPQDIPMTSEGNRPDDGLNADVSISALILLPLQYVTRPTINPTGPGQVYIEQGVRFFKLFLLGNDLSLRDCLYTSGIAKRGEQPAGESEGRSTIVTPPDNRAKTPGWAFRSTRVVTEEDFIVEDGAEENSEQSDIVEMSSAAMFGKIDTHASRIKNRDARAAQVQEKVGDVWTLNFEPIYDLAFLQDDKRRIVESGEAEVLAYGTPPQDTEETGPHTYHRTLEGRILAKRSIGFRPIETLLELYMPPSYFGDVDKASLDLQQFLDAIESSKDGERSEMSLTIKALVPIPLFKFPFQRTIGQEQQGGIDVNSLSELYDRLVDVWVTSLPRAASGKLRLAKERIARRVAAELYLSGIGIALKDSKQEGEWASDEQGRAEGRNMEIPIRSREGLSRDLEKGKGKGKQRRESSISPLPSVLDAGLERHTGSSLSSRSRRTLNTTPSLHSHSSYGSRESRDEDASCTRLRAYTSLTAQPPLPPTMASILAHWEVDSDPSSYSWNATCIALAAANGDKESASGGDGAVLRQLSREKRLLKHQRRSRVASTSSSQPIESGRLWGGQPVPAPQSSLGQADDDIVLASQIERGIFGGRPKRKKRKAGF